MSTSESVIFKPRFLPRDAIDVLIALFVAIPFQIFPLFGLPTLVVLFLTNSIALAFLAFLLAYAVFLSFSVWSVRLESAGLRFRRLLGKPKLLPWLAIRNVSEASRSEVVLRGWLWPLFPAREMTAALSARGHIRVEWDGGHCYFPPREPDEFLTLVRERISRHVA